MNGKGVFVSLLFLAVALTPATVPSAERVLGCCKCLGDVVTVTLHTGSSPWKVRPPGSGPAITTLPTWTASAPPASWIQPSTKSLAQTFTPAGTTYKYSVQFDVPDNCTIPYDNVQLGFKWAADDTGRVYLDSALIRICGGPGGCFQTIPGIATFPVPLGGHVLRVDVTNRSGYSGLLVWAQLTGTCPSGLTKASSAR